MYNPQTNIQHANIQLRNINAERFKVRKYQNQLRLNLGQFPEAESSARKKLADTREYMRKVGEAAESEAGQRKKLGDQVDTQRASIDKSARDLARQGEEGHRNLSKHSSAAAMGYLLAEQKWNYAVDQWWDTVVRGVIEAIDAQQRNILLMIGRAYSASRKAMLFGRSGVRYRVVYHTHRPMSEGERFPDRRGVDAARERIGNIKQAKQKQDAQLEKYKKKLRAAYASLDERKEKAGAQIDAQLAERRQQMIKGKKSERQLLKHIEGLKKKKSKIRSEQGRMRGAQGQLAQNRARQLRRIAAIQADDALQRQNIPLVERYINDTKATPPIKRAQPGLAPGFEAWMAQRRPGLYAEYRAAKRKQSQLPAPAPAN